MFLRHFFPKDGVQDKWPGSAVLIKIIRRIEDAEFGSDLTYHARI